MLWNKSNACTKKDKKEKKVNFQEKKKSDNIMCFTCNKSGHFSYNCPYKFEVKNEQKEYDNSDSVCCVHGGPQGI